MWIHVDLTPLTRNVPPDVVFAPIFQKLSHFEICPLACAQISLQHNPNTHILQCRAILHFITFISVPSLHPYNTWNIFIFTPASLLFFSDHFFNKCTCNFFSLREFSVPQWRIHSKPLLDTVTVHLVTYASSSDIRQYLATFILICLFFVIK